MKKRTRLRFSFRVYGLLGLLCWAQQAGFSTPVLTYATYNDSNADQDTDKGGDENVHLYDYNR